MLKQTANFFHESGAKKFLLLLSVVFVYAAFVIFHYGLKDGLNATLLTWAFFVLCTPVADAGFLVDFPVRLIIGVRMIWSEIIVWSLAITIALYSLFINPAIFDINTILRLFHTVISTPWPFWTIILLSASGTFLSINIGDQIYSLVGEHKHHKRIAKLKIKRVAVEITLLLFVISLYVILLQATNVSISS